MSNFGPYKLYLYYHSEEMVDNYWLTGEVYRRMGNRGRTSFWRDPWMGNTPLCEQLCVVHVMIGDGTFPGVRGCLCGR